jgi:NUMOD3 motif
MPQIYGLYDPSEENETPYVRYVGYTGFSIERRIIEHISDAVRGHQNYRCNWIRSLLSRDVRPAAICLEEITIDNWQERERHWIALLRPQLTNTTDGGEGLINPSQEVRERIAKKTSINLKSNTRRKGIPHSDISKQKIREGLAKSEKRRIYVERLKGKTPLAAVVAAKAVWAAGKKRSPEYVEKMRQRAIGNKGRSGQKLTEEHRAKLRLRNIGNSYGLGHVHTDEARRKISESRLGSRYITNGVECRLIHDGVVPDGWRLGMSPRSKSCP